MKKIFLVLLFFAHSAHALRSLPDASKRFQDSLNAYLKNKNTANAQAVVNEYDSSENNDKYRRTFDSTLQVNKLTINQLRSLAAAVPAPTRTPSAMPTRTPAAQNAPEQAPHQLVTVGTTPSLPVPAEPSVPTAPVKIQNAPPAETTIAPKIPEIMPTPALVTEPVVTAKEKETLLDIQELERFAHVNNLSQDPKAQAIINDFKARPVNFIKAKSQLRQISIDTRKID